MVFGDISLEIGQKKRGREDNLLSLLNDGTNPNEASDNLGYQVHGVLQKFLLYLIQTGK